MAKKNSKTNKRIKTEEPEEEEEAFVPREETPEEVEEPSSSAEEESLPRESQDTAIPEESTSVVEEAGEDVVTTRLVIRDIDVENFKSYYGQHRIGPFHKTFTAVIGPNGSGKSNVIDSMLFVFGRNAKKIRLEKLSELIHSSAAHPDVSYASVTVNFVRVYETKKDATDPVYRKEVPNSQLSVKREVYRSGVSQYSIDGQRKTQKEVVEHLIKEGIDLEHNRFLILQGEVEQIALMKPKAEKEGEEGLLEYLDDLIGTNEYVERVTDLSAAVEQAQTERLEALDKEKKLKSEKDALDDAKNSTIAFVTKDNQLQKTLIAMCQLRMRGIEEKLEEPRRLLKKIEDNISAYQDDVNIRKDAKTRAEETAAKLKKETAEVTKERDDIRHKKQNVEGVLEKLKSGADEFEKARKKVRDGMKKCSDEKQKALLQQQDAERECAIHQKNLEEATANVEKFQKEHEKLSTELLPKLRPLRQALEEKKKSFAPFEAAVTEAGVQLANVKNHIQTLNDQRIKKTETIEKLNDQVRQNKARVEEIDAVLQNAENNLTRQEEIVRLQDKLTATSRQKHAIDHSIQELKQSYREGEAGDRTMEFLLSQRSLKGYYGTLRQLGRIDDQYDTAAGVSSNAWGFHVVEDRATATSALQLLKEHNIGRATMMVVSEIEKENGDRCTKPFTCPTPKCKRLFDLIQPTNPKFKSVFYQAVRDTLVVDSLVTAREIAFGGMDQKRYRVVTLKGELVEPNGSITGGGATPKGAKLKAARSPQDKQAIKEEMQRLQTQLIQAAEDEKALQLRLHQMTEEENKLTPDHARKLRAEKSKLSAMMESDTLRIHVLREDLDKENDPNSQAEYKSLLREAEECESKLEKAQKSRLSHHKEIEELEEEIETTGGTAFKEVSDGLKREQDRLEAEEASLRTCRRNAQKHRATQERKEEEQKELEKKLQKIEAEAEEGAKEQIAECASELENLSRQLMACEQRLAKVQAKSDEARANVPIAHSALVAAQKKLDDEVRYEQTEKVKLADAMQQINQFEVKINDCEDKIRNNLELYGTETLQLQAADESGSDNDDDEDASQGGEGSDDEEEAESTGETSPASSVSRKRGRRSREEEHKRRKRTRLEGEAPQENVAQMSFRLTPEELERCDYDRSYHLAKALTEETKRLHDEIDFRAVSLWRERDMAHRQALAIYTERKEVSDKLEKELEDLKSRRRTEFLRVFEVIRKKLKEVYQQLTHGGDADMELVDSNDPFEGIQFVVRPPKKSWKQISNLSGGEKTLSSLALIFALHHVKPTPIYVMDEIDAALDFRNVSIVANYVLRQASGAQFIIISLRNNMFEMAHQLVGVCKVNDVTATLVLMPRAFQARMNQLLGMKEEKRQRGIEQEREEEEEEERSPEDKVKSCMRNSNQENRLSRKNVRFSSNAHQESEGISTQE